jgi:hypothetical protein
MPIELEAIETLKRGAAVVDPASGTVVMVKKVKTDGEFVVLEIGLAYCLEIRRPGGSVISVWRRRRKKGKETKS